MAFEPNPPPSGATRLHQFGEAIREQRELAGLSIARLAEPLGYSVSAWARYETGGTIPRELPGKLDEALGTRGMFKILWRMVKHERFPNRYRDYMRLEDEACEIHEYAPYRIPGLLQTGAYARALFRAAKPEAPDYKIDAKVDDRLSRQDRLQWGDAPFFSAVLDEATIRRMVGGPAVMCEQLETLLPFTDRTGSRLQVAPFERGERGALGGPLILLTLPDEGHAAYLEGMANGQLLEDPDAVRKQRQAYDRVMAEALTPGQSADLIAAAIKEHRT